MPRPPVHAAPRRTAPRRAAPRRAPPRTLSGLRAAARGTNGSKGSAAREASRVAGRGGAAGVFVPLWAFLMIRFWERKARAAPRRAPAPHGPPRAKRRRSMRSFLVARRA